MTTMYATAAGAGGKTGVDWDNAFGAAELYDDIEDNSEAGDIYYVYSGTYTLGEAINASARNGTAALAIEIIGVDSTANEPPLATQWAYGDDRPLLEFGANQFLLGDYWVLQNLRFTTAHANGLQADDWNTVYNCKGQQTSGTPNYEVFTLDDFSRLISCEASGTNANGFVVGRYSSGVRLYAHDCLTGYVVEKASTYHDCIADTCTGTGFTLLNTHAFVTISNSTIYGCAKGCYSSGAFSHLVLLSNIFSTNTIGVELGAASTGLIVDYNNWHDSGTPAVLNVTQGPNATTHDPQFVDAAGGDFRLKGGSLCRRAGMPLTLGMGGKTIPTAQGVYPNYGAFGSW
ncbi:MAG: hypothetical protein HQ581_14905 [Planctomycetes bacterium]|nr:hypothetical protein [Planctomycetota bacterium]